MNISSSLEGSKRFITTIITVCVLAFISISLVILFMFGKVTFVEVSPIISSIVLVLGGVVGGYLGLQSATDYFKQKSIDKNSVQGDVNAKS